MISMRPGPTGLITALADIDLEHFGLAMVQRETMLSKDLVEAVHVSSL
jgi:hypothetical protein